MEKPLEFKSKQAKDGELVIHSFTGSGWQKILVPVVGIGVIRVKDNLRSLGTTGEPLVLPKVKPDAVSRFFSIRVGAKTFNLEFKEGDSVVSFLAGQETQVWTNARLEPANKG
jgi:hypothetical protein